MQGFTDKALVLLSQPDKFQEASGFYRNDYMTAVVNLLAYLHSVDITPVCLVTDGLAVKLLNALDCIVWQATEDAGGMFYIKSNVHPYKEPTAQLPANIKQVLDTKHPIERGMSMTERGVIEVKRVALAEKELIKSFNCVFVFGNLFKVRPKPEDGRAIFSINNQFIPTLKLSGYDAPINSFLGVPWGNLALTEWGKYNGKSEGQCD